MSFFNELKRRNVFKVAAAYIIVGWLIMQAGEVMSPALRLPEWVNSTLAFFLILGFPVALVFAWAFEMTPDGLKKEKEVDRSQSITPVTGQKLNYTIIALMAVALAYFAWDKFSPAGENPQELTQAPEETQTKTEVANPEIQTVNKKSIAVIPFQNRSANEENAEFFSDGVHDELLTNLSKIGDLKVISRTSVMSYRDTTKNIQQIASELGVANILEGGVQRAGDTVRINVQLIDAASDEHIWAEIYDRQLSAENIFAIQTEIARAIANELEATLSPREQELLATQPTKNLEALDNFLIGYQLLVQSNWQTMRDAQTYLRKAIELDPRFVQAYIYLAISYFKLFETGAMTLEEASVPGFQAALTALSLDQNNATAYAAQALLMWISNREGVEEAFNKALKLEPNNADIIIMYGTYLRKTARPDQALPLYQKARNLDPVSVDVLFGLARIHEARHEISEALEMLARVRQIEPASTAGIGPVAGIHMMTGNLVEAMTWLFKALAVDPDDSDLHNWIARIYFFLGDYATAGRWHDWIEQNGASNPMGPAGMSMLNIYQGNIDASIQTTRPALENPMPDRWGSDSILIRALLIWALDQDQTTAALDLARQAHPELFEAPPVVNAGNVLQAIDSAHLLISENQQQEARVLLQAAVVVYEEPYRLAATWQSSGKAQALAMLGEKQAALNELRSLVDNGWRNFWRWDTELNPNFNSLHDDPEFQSIVESLRTDMARQREELRLLEEAGEIPPPPGGDA